MKNFVHIKSTIPAEISINGENISSQQVDICASHDFYIAFFPKTLDRYLPCATSFYGDIRPKSIKKIPFKNNHYDIIFNPAVVPTSTDETIILNKKYNNTIFNVSNSQKSFISIVNSSFTHSSTSDLMKNVKFQSRDGYSIINGKISNDKEYLMIFNSKKNIVLIENVFDKVEFSGSAIKAMKNNNSLSGYGVVYEFNLNSKSLSTYSIFVNKIANKISVDELIPMAFLESIQYGDYKTAKSYLDNPNITSEHLKNYFGSIKEIHFNPYSNDINYTILSDNYKSFTFYINNKKITEIEENILNLV